jgi:hypothetical protein
MNRMTALSFVNEARSVAGFMNDDEPAHDERTINPMPSKPMNLFLMPDNSIRSPSYRPDDLPLRIEAEPKLRYLAKGIVPDHGGNNNESSEREVHPG